MNVTGGNGKDWSIPIILLIQVFGYFKNIGDGKYEQGSHDVKNSTQNFLDRKTLQFDRKKASKIGLN